MAKVFRRDRAVGVDDRLLRFLDICAGELSFDIQVREGLRSDAKQAEYFRVGRHLVNGKWVMLRPDDPTSVWTYASSALDGAHGRGGALDLDVLGDGGVVLAAGSAGAKYDALMFLAEAEGLVSGRRWTAKFGPQGDAGHVELSDWKSLSLRGSSPTPVEVSAYSEPDDEYEEESGGSSGSFVVFLVIAAGVAWLIR